MKAKPMTRLEAKKLSCSPSSPRLLAMYPNPKTASFMMLFFSSVLCGWGMTSTRRMLTAARKVTMSIVRMPAIPMTPRSIPAAAGAIMFEMESARLSIPLALA